MFKRLFTCVALVCLVVFSTQSINAQDANGIKGKRGAPLARDVAADPVTVPTAGPWQEFLFFGPGSSAVGCLSGGCAGPGMNAVFAGDPPWTFTAGAGGAIISVTDAFLKGDRFEIFDGASSLGVTSVPAATGACGPDPDPCFADPGVSTGVFWVGPGAHSITIKAIASPFGSGAAYFKVEPGMTHTLDHYLCYDVKPEKGFRQRKVDVKDQFGGQTYVVIAPRLLCVPATKRHLD